MATAARVLVANSPTVTPPVSKEPSQTTRKTVQVTQEGDVEAVQVDALAVLKIVRHCLASQLQPPPAGLIVGLNTSGDLAVSDSLPLPQNHIFPANLPEEVRERERDSWRRKEEAFDTAAQNAASFSAPILRRMGELNSDALNGTVGFYLGVRDGVVIGQGNSGLVEALVRYQLGSEGYIGQKNRPGLRGASSQVSPGSGVALVYDIASAKQGIVSLRAFRLTDSYVNAYRAAKADSSSNTAEQAILPSDILQEFPVTITRSSLLMGFLSELTESTDPENTPLDVPTPGKGLEQPLHTLLSNLDQAVNSMGNLRYRDRRNKVGPGDALDAIKGLAASDGAARSLNEAAGVDLVRTFGARTNSA